MKIAGNAKRAEFLSKNQVDSFIFAVLKSDRIIPGEKNKRSGSSAE
jgi:hypothetical protein